MTTTDNSQFLEACMQIIDIYREFGRIHPADWAYVEDGREEFPAIYEETMKMIGEE